jgi:hypothetical protein
MNETTLLIGSLSNDLFRVASLQQRGALQASRRFLQESKRWAQPLSTQKLKPYIQKIIQEVNSLHEDDLSNETAEQCLMYGVLLQNYVLHLDTT